MTEISVRLLSLDDSGEAAAWDAYAVANDASLGYFGLDWLRIIRTAFGHPAYPLAAFQGDTIRGILPLSLVSSRLFGRFLVSVPFVNYGGILANNGETAALLLRKAASLRAELRARSVELRNGGLTVHGLPSRSNKVTMLLDLPDDPETLWKNFKDKVRNQVRKARKNGLTIIRGGVELLDDFYRVFCVNMRDLGTPVYARKFFATVLERLPQSTGILSVRHNGACIAAGITYAYGDTLQMPWASSLISSHALCPNHMLYWEALSQGCADGYSIFDFGRSTVNSGPWKYKRQWGTRELRLHWEYLLKDGTSLPELNVANPKFQLAIAAWKRLPLVAANTLGPRIVRCIP